MNGYAYLASPYSNENRLIMGFRYVDAQRATVWLIRQGIVAYAPIVYTHPLVSYGFPPETDFWIKIDKPLLERASAFIILTLNGWTESKGIGIELKMAETLNLPTFTMCEVKTNEYVLSKH